MDSFEMLAEQEKDSFRGKQTARLARTCALQRLSHDVFMGYASMLKCSCDMQFVHLKKLVCNVESMLYSMTEVLSEALEQVLSEMKVQRAKLYFEDYEDFERKRQCLQYGLLLKPEYDALYFANMKEIPDIYCEKRRLLLVKREEFLQKLRKIIIEIMEKRALTNNAFLRALSTHLREQKIILTQVRSDRYCNNAAMYRLYEESMFAGVDPIKDCSCFVLNIENARIAQILQLEDPDVDQILLEDLENKREATSIRNVGEWHHSEANLALREICRSYF